MTAAGKWAVTHPAFRGKERQIMFYWLREQKTQSLSGNGKWVEVAEAGEAGDYFKNTLEKILK